MNHVLKRREALLGFAQVEPKGNASDSPHAVSDVRAFRVVQSAPANSYVVLQVRTQSGLLGLR